MPDYETFSPQIEWHRKPCWDTSVTRCGKRTSVEEIAFLNWPKAWGPPPGKMCHECFPLGSLPEEAPDG